jgi:hypothetical protein
MPPGCKFTGIAPAQTFGRNIAGRASVLLCQKSRRESSRTGIFCYLGNDEFVKGWRRAGFNVQVFKAQGEAEVVGI